MINKLSNLTTCESEPVVGERREAGTARTLPQPTESSTQFRQVKVSDERLDRKIERAFSDARRLRFEDGMESSFSRTLEYLIEQSGTDAIDAIARLVKGGTAEPEVVGEALRWIGLSEDRGTHAYRLWLLCECLKSQSPYVKDGALLGISFLDDLGAIGALKRAIEMEKHTSLREDLRQVLEQLEAQRCRS